MHPFFSHSIAFPLGNHRVTHTARDENITRYGNVIRPVKKLRSIAPRCQNRGYGIPQLDCGSPVLFPVFAMGETPAPQPYRGERGGGRSSPQWQKPWKRRDGSRGKLRDAVTPDHRLTAH